MRASLIPLADLSANDVAAWRQLGALALEPNPFHEPDYVLSLAAGLGVTNQVGLLVVRDGPDWRACAPVHRGRWHRVPAPSLSTWRGHVLYGLLGTPLIARERSTEALEALIAGMLDADRVSFAALEWVTGDGPIGAELERVLGEGHRSICFERFSRAAVHRREEPTYLEETLSPKHRREVRRQRRKLGEALDSELEVVDRAGEDAAYGEFIQMEAVAKQEKGTVLRADPGHAAFFREMCRRFAEQDRLQLLELRAANRTLAAKCNLIAGDTIFCFKITFDKSWATYSPGIQLEVELLRLFHERSEARMMDSCADPNNAMINRLWPDRRTLVTKTLPKRGLAGTVTAMTLLAARSVRNRNQRKTQS